MYVKKWIANSSFISDITIFSSTYGQLEFFWPQITMWRNQTLTNLVLHTTIHGGLTHTSKISKQYKQQTQTRLILNSFHILQKLGFKPFCKDVKAKSSTLNSKYPLWNGIGLKEKWPKSWKHNHHKLKLSPRLESSSSHELQFIKEQV